MGRKLTTFRPYRNPRFAGKFPKLVTCETTAYGLVIHRAIASPVREKRGFWDVSDPDSGALVANGLFPGREGAVAALVEIARKYQTRPGGFHDALREGRERLAKEKRA